MPRRVEAVIAAYVEAVIAVRVGRRHIKPCGLRMGCHLSSYVCKGR